MSKVDGMGRLVAITFSYFLLVQSTDKVQESQLKALVSLLTLLCVKALFRVLIAATDFQPGDFIFREKELVVGANNQWNVRRE